MNEDLFFNPAYKVADINLADWATRNWTCRKARCQDWWPCKKKYGKEKPLKGALSSQAHCMTIQTAMLIQHTGGTGCGRALRSQLQHLLHSGPCCRCHCCCNIGSVFAWKGENLSEYWWCTLQTIDFGWKRPDGDCWRWRRCHHDDSRGLLPKRTFRLDTKPAGQKRRRGQSWAILKNCWRLGQQSGFSDKMAKNIKAFRRDHNRRSPSVSDDGRLAAFPGFQRERLGYKIKFDNPGCRESLADGIKAAMNIARLPTSGGGLRMAAKAASIQKS